VLIDYRRQWRPDILRWIAAILIFALFAWIIVDYFDVFDSCLDNASCVRGDCPARLSRRSSERVATTIWNESLRSCVR
jgi:hypothetical protein